MTHQEMINLTFERTYPVSVETLYRAFSDHETLAKWFGPEGFTNTIHEFNLVPGGAYRLTMHGPDGTDYPSQWLVLDVVPNEKIEMKHEDKVYGFSSVYSFIPEADGAKLHWVMTLPTDFPQGLDFIKEMNKQNLDRLGRQLGVN